MMGNEQTENAVPKIYAAILGVMNEVGAVSKEKTCKSNFVSYKFRDECAASCNGKESCFCDPGNP